MVESLNVFQTNGLEISPVSLSELISADLNRVTLDIARGNNFLALAILEPQYDSNPDFDHYPLNIDSYNVVKQTFQKRQGYKFIGINKSNCREFLSEEVIEKHALAETDKQFLLTIFKRNYDYNGYEGTRVAVAFRETNLDSSLVNQFDSNGKNFFRGSVDDPWVCFETFKGNEELVSKSGIMHAVRNTVNNLHTRKYNSMRNPFPTSIAIDTMHYACLFEQLHCVNNLVQFCYGQRKLSIEAAMDLFNGLLSFYKFEVKFTLDRNNPLRNKLADPEALLNLIFEPITNSRKNGGTNSTVHMSPYDNTSINIKIIDDARFNVEMNPNIMRLFFDNDSEYLIWVSTLSDQEFEKYHSSSSLTDEDKSALKQLSGYFRSILNGIKSGFDLDFLLNSNHPGEEDEQLRILLRNIYEDSYEVKSTNGNGGFGLPQILRIVQKNGGTLHPPLLQENGIDKSLVLGYTLPTNALITN